MLNLEGSRYIVRSDELGSRLVIDPLEGTGTLRLGLKQRKGAAGNKPTEMRATAIGRDGSVFALTGSEPAMVPVGEYRLSNLTLSLDDSKSGQLWSFVFSDGTLERPASLVQGREGRGGHDRPGGQPELRAEAVRFQQGGSAGRRHRRAARPLYGRRPLDHRRLLRAPVSPSTQELLGARIALVKHDGQTMATAHAGFS